MKRAIITGATSFIGRHLVMRLLAESWEIFAIVRRDCTKKEVLPNNKKIHIIELDMEEYFKLPNIINLPCDVFVSLAWNGTRGNKRFDDILQESNYKNSLSALEAIIKIGCKVVISAGSQAEYGIMTVKTDEEMLCCPNTAYGKWKLKFYEIGFEMCRNNNVSFREPRFFSLYGRDDYEKTLINSVLNAMLTNTPCHLTKSIQMWNFLHIDDAVEGIIKLLESNCSEGAYNFGSEDTRPLKEFILEMKALTHSKSNLLFGDIPYPKTGMVNIWPNITKLKNETGWNPHITFKDGINDIIRYKLRKQEK